MSPVGLIKFIPRQMVCLGAIKSVQKEFIMQQGNYSGVPYIVTEKKGKTYIGLQPDMMSHLSGLGADLTLLDDIGDQDPDEAMEAMFDSIPEKEE